MAGYIEASCILLHKKISCWFESAPRECFCDGEHGPIQQGLPRYAITEVVHGISSGEVTAPEPQALPPPHLEQQFTTLHQATERCFLPVTSENSCAGVILGSHVPLTLRAPAEEPLHKAHKSSYTPGGRWKIIPRHLGFANLIPTADKI